MPTLWTLSGMPGSGKTTLAKKLGAEYNAKIFHYDDLPDSHNPMEFDNVHDRMYEQIAMDIVEGFDVVVDDLHIFGFMRKRLLERINTPCRKVLIIMTTPFEECFRRNLYRENRLSDAVMFDLKDTFQSPTDDEGWDEVIYI